MDEIHYLYVLTNETTGKQYVGVTKDPVRRFNSHMTEDTNSGIVQDRAFHNFRIDILNKGSKKYIYSLEELTINKLGTREPHGYNIALGGCGGDTGCAVRGSKSGKAKLNEDSVLAIRERHAQGETLKSLAVEFGVEASTVGCICRGKTWTHVGGPIRDSRRVSTELKEQVIKLRDEGKTYKEISQLLGVPESSAQSFYSKRKT